MNIRKFFSCLTVPLLAVSIINFSPHAEAAANDSIWFHSIRNTWDNFTEGNPGEDIQSKQGQTIAPLGTNATKEQVQQYVVDSLNSNNAISSDIQVKGRTKAEDGTTRVAITYQDDNQKKDVVVNIDEAGSAEISNLSDEEMQAAYDAIVYGGDNTMTTYDIQATNTYLHDSDNFITTISDALGVSAETAASTAAGAVSLSGMFLLGVGSTNTQKAEIIENAQAAVRKRAANKMASDAKGYMASNPSSIAHADSGTFNQCVTDYQYNGLTSATKQFLNTLSTNYYNATGIVINLTSAYRPEDLNSYHSDGIAFDATADEWDGPNGKYYRDIYTSMAREMGGKPLDEYPGEPGEIYARGSNIHVSVHNQDASY